MSKLSILIVTYNSKQIIDRCLENIISSDYDITIIDNASNDGTAEYISHNYHSVKLIISDKNIGYGRAANLGLKHVTSDYALLINPDIITSRGIITQLMQKVGPYPNTAIFAPQARIDKITLNHESESVNWTSGAAMLFDMKKLKDIGYFDENIFLFYEESDLCMRARDKGYEIVIFNDIFMEHLIGKSSGTSDAIEKLKHWHKAWSRFYFNKKHLSSFEYRRKTISYLLKFFYKYLIYLLTGNKKKRIKFQASIAGAVAYLQGKKAFDENGDPRGIANNFAKDINNNKQRS